MKLFTSMHVRKEALMSSQMEGIQTQKTADVLGLSYNTVATAIKNLCALGILVESKGKSRSKTFVYSAYLDMLKMGTE